MLLHALTNIGNGVQDGIHLFWSPPYPTGYALNGFAIERRESRQEINRDCFDVSSAALALSRRQGLFDFEDGRILAWPTQGDVSSENWTYRIDLTRVRNLVEITAEGIICGFAARDDGQVIDGRMFTENRCRLTGGDIKTIWLVAWSTRPNIRICSETRSDSFWDEAVTIVSELQLPFESVNPNVASVADGMAIAAGRVPGETLEADFQQMAQYSNAVLGRPFDIPAWKGVVRDTTLAQEDRWDIHALGLLLGASNGSYAWRRALGFGFVDTRDLIAGVRYDYRLLADTYRTDRDEVFYDLHTVPNGYRLSSRFRLGAVAFTSTPDPIVEFESILTGALEVANKYISFEELSIDLPEQRSTIIIDGRSDTDIEVVGSSFVSGEATFAMPLSKRSVLTFPFPVDRVVLRGPARFCGLCVDPLSEGQDPRQQIRVQAAVYGVEFGPGRLPEPPSNVTAQNLGAVSRATRLGHRDRNTGIELSWTPTHRLDVGAIDHWPRDAKSAPPTDTHGYRITRQVNGGVFEHLSELGDLYLSSRHAVPGGETPGVIANVLSIFPPPNQPSQRPQQQVFAKDFIADPPPRFGDELQYRITAVDLLNRESTAVETPSVLLKKYNKPPSPTSHPDAFRFNDTSPVASGLTARLVQAANPDLSADDQSRVAVHGDHVLLRWGWGENERAVDPYVTEFRIYDAAGSLVELTASNQSVPIRTGSSNWSATYSFDREVRADELVGRRIVLGAAFTVLSHGVGNTLTIEFASNVIDPDLAPSTAGFKFTRLDGSEDRPESWDRRLKVLPRNPSLADANGVEAYEVVLPADWLSVSANTPRQSRMFGVSAADQEDYVADRRSVPPSRVGNEGQFSTALISARYFGRPVLEIADLGPVTSVTLNRNAANEIVSELRPSDHLPGDAVVTERIILERCPASAILPRVSVDDDGAKFLQSDGSAQMWSLSTSDLADLTTQFEDRSISDRFLAHAAAQLRDLDNAYFIVGNGTPSSKFRDVLPNTPRRWVYRIRAQDAAGRTSAEGQVLKMVSRVPSPARASAPELLSLSIENDNALLKLLSRDLNRGQIFTAYLIDSRDTIASATLSSVKQRPDLSPETRFLVRDDEGSRLDLRSVEIDPSGHGTLGIAIPRHRRLSVWAFAVSEDGVPSRLAGPLFATNGRLEVLA